MGHNALLNCLNGLKKSFYPLSLDCISNDNSVSILGHLRCFWHRNRCLSVIQDGMIKALLASHNTINSSPYIPLYFNVHNREFEIVICNREAYAATSWLIFHSLLLSLFQHAEWDLTRVRFRMTLSQTMSGFIAQSRCFPTIIVHLICSLHLQRTNGQFLENHRLRPCWFNNSGRPYSLT